MAESSVRKRFFAFDSHQNTQKVPFCQEIRNFIEESYKCQTLYANCEGFYRRRVGSCRQNQWLKEFIFSSMYHNEYTEWQSQANSDRMIHVVQIWDKMISLCKKFNLDDEIHFSVIWVYYFEYELKTKKATPVFKIFKRKTGSEAIFLDVSLKTYESWDCYLDNAEFNESFLCVPQHGEYNFDKETNKLILQYVRSMKLKKNEDLGSALPKAPFSQVAVRPLFATLKTLTSKIVKQLKQFLRKLSSYLNEWKYHTFNVVIFLIAAWLQIKKFSPFSFETISTKALMLLNKVAETRNYNEILKFDYWTTNLLPDFSVLHNNITEVSKEGTHLFRLLLSEKKDWLEIFSVFCSLLKSNRPVLNAVSYMVPDCLPIRIAVFLLGVIEKISEKLISEPGSHKLPEIDNYSPEINLVCRNENFEINSSILPPNYTPNSSVLDSRYKLPSAVDFETQNAVEQFRHPSYEKVLSNLPSLKSTSLNSVYNLLFEYSSEEFLENEELGPIDALSAIAIGEEDGYAIFIFLKTSFVQLTFCILKRLLKTDFHFTPREDLFRSRGVFIAELISHSVKSSGFLLFPQEHYAFGIFPLEMIQEKEKTSLELALWSE